MSHFSRRRALLYLPKQFIIMVANIDLYVMTIGPIQPYGQDIFMYHRYMLTSSFKGLNKVR